MGNETIQKRKHYRQAEVEAMYRRNPNPVQRYEITMTIENPPGPFDSVKGYAQYEAPDCIYLMNPAEGVHNQPMTTIDVSFRKIDDRKYSAVFYEDAMLNEDYFGTGVCKWKFTFARAELKATGADNETTFVLSFASKETRSSKAITSYFWKGSYPREGAAAFSDFGFPSPETYKPSLRDELFTISFDIEAAAL